VSLVEDTVINQQYLSLLKRVSFLDPPSATIIGPVNNNPQAVASTGISIPVPVGQAIRVIKANYQLQVVAAPGTVTPVAWSFSVEARANSVAGTPIRFWGFPVTGARINNSCGLNFSAVEDELFIYNDYLELGVVPGSPVAFQGVAGVTNPDAAQNATLEVFGTILVEYYSLKPSGVVIGPSPIK
jgi:hypothetical protein